VSDNQVTLVGNLTDDPEMRHTPAGLPVANFRLAVNPRVWDGEGWKDGEASFFRVNVWRDQAEHVTHSLRKGARCVVVGRLRSHSWETPEGQRRSAVEVEADEVAASLRFSSIVPTAPATPDTSEAAPSQASDTRGKGGKPAKAGGSGRRSRNGEPVAVGTTFDDVPF
jgi:single-strand DNA-binding protein